jgi:hypothetical protein
MMNTKLRLSAFLFWGLGVTRLLAQDALTATGGNVSGSTGSVSYSIGQIAYVAESGTTGSAAEGVQQPYEIYTITGIEEASQITLIASAYPNPATDFIILKTEGYTTANLTYQLYGSNGQLLESRKIEGNETRICMSTHPAASYFLIVTNNDNELKTFKITKSH